MIATVEAAGRVDIRECCLDTDADISLGDAYADLNDEERARAASFVFDRDRDRFIRARGFLRWRLGGFLAMTPKDVPIIFAADGEKPFLDGDLAAFNLSHSGPRAVLAITSGEAVGIDLELIDRSDNFADEIEGLSEVCFTDHERAALAGLPPEPRVRRFLSYWTAKEARMKLTGEGMALNPLDISLALSNGAPVGYLQPDRPAADLLFIPLAHPGAICCLAMGRP